MDDTLTVRDKVVTGDVLAQCHSGQARLCLGPGAVLTPSGWDFVSQHGLQVVRGAAPPEAPIAAPAASVPSPAPTDPEIREVLPAVAEDTRIVQEGRCDHPDRPCGCKSDEFGSGFVQPEDCDACPVQPIQREGRASVCDGCSRQAVAPAAEGVDVETLVRVITEQVLARLQEAE